MLEENIKKSKTQEFRLYLNAEIKRMVGDRDLLHGALEGMKDSSSSSLTRQINENRAFDRYAGKTSNELKRQISEDIAELGRVERYLNSLEWVRDLNIDIDLFEETIPMLNIAWHVRDAESNFLNLTMVGEVTSPSEALRKFTVFLHNRSVEFKISESVRLGFTDLLRIESGSTHIKWVFKDQSIWLVLNSKHAEAPYLTLGN